MKRIAMFLLFSVGLASCSGGGAEPVPIDTRNDACAWCRMTISDVHTAAELVAPSEEPKLFDDVGCLRDYLAVAANRRQIQGAVAYVADYRTGAWVAAARAVYTQVPALDTAMASHLIAHADAASRDADPAAATGVPVPVYEIFGPGGPPSRTTPRETRKP